MKQLNLKVKYPNGDDVYSVEIPLNHLMDAEKASVEKYGYVFEFEICDSDQKVATTQYLEKKKKVNQVLKDISDGNIDLSAYETAAKEMSSIPLEEVEKEEIKTPKDVNDIINNYEKHEREKEKRAAHNEENKVDPNNLPVDQIIDKITPRKVAAHRKGVEADSGQDTPQQ